MFNIERDHGIEIKHWCAPAGTRMSILGICYCTSATNEGVDRPTAAADVCKAGITILDKYTTAL